VWKLRTMWESRPARGNERGWVEWIVAEPGELRKDRDDTRVASRFARFCRRHSIDELPQFWHVLRGDMSLIGPRPLTRTELLNYYGPHAEEILSVKPGITGLWQTQGRSHLDWSTRVELDIKIVRTHSVKAKVAIFIRTVIGLFSGDGAW
jgi:exopolysaccharide production protein ExoY